MKSLVLRCASLLATTALIVPAAMLVGCVVAGGGGYGNGGGGAEIGIGVDYYEPFGGVYGDWAPGYRVGPYRDGGHGRGEGGSRPHAYRPAPGSHPMPSIPGRPRGSR
ncbi:MAG TPA: hypothetical protein VIF60_07750 [Burkholderiaceae bacterium]|jgi:hypothetical protein